MFYRQETTMSGLDIASFTFPDRSCAQYDAAAKSPSTATEMLAFS
jgi:hypothetical protein